MSEKNYYSIDPEGKLMCRKCGVPLENEWFAEVEKYEKDVLSKRV